ncbi:Leucine-rich repeat domain superfamily [Sesbania bispinosa]|nr:Leucine-rich repeat domain superfamily [Sesbania bispinosa]
MPDEFCCLSSLIILNLTGNNFVSPPSIISKLPKLEYLRLNWCNKLQRLPELPLSIQELDASNCVSLETSKLNPSRPCSLFATQRQWRLRLPREVKIFLEELHLPRARFDMLITGSEIPSWFVPQKCVSFAKIPVPNNCPPTEWVGFALCFMLVSHADPELCPMKLIVTCLDLRVSCLFPPGIYLLCSHIALTFIFSIYPLMNVVTDFMKVGTSVKLNLY